MEKVILIGHHLLRNLRKVMAQKMRQRFSKGEKVAIKMHMGEYGNLNYIRPPIAELIVDELKKIGAKPFIIDTPTVYHGTRDTPEKYLETARKNGFSEETMSCPIIISDKGITLKSRYLSKLAVAKELYEADGLVVLSHFKGHECSNFGGAIKNLGMGGFTKETKGIMHAETGPNVGDNCIGCGECVRACPQKAIKIKNKRAVIDYDECFGCCACVEVCRTGAMKPKTVRFSRALTEAASFIVKKFDKRIIYANVLMDISKYCDCLPIGDKDMGQIVSPDIGILVSDNITAIEKASLDLVQKSTKNEFGKTFMPKLDEQFLSAADFGLGKGEYKLEIL